MKASTFRLFGLGPTDRVEDTFRKSVEWMMAKDALKPRGQHDILMWAEWLTVSKPALTGVAYPLAFGNEIKLHAGRIDAEWVPALRYHRLTVPFVTTLGVQTSARRLLTEQHQL